VGAWAIGFVGLFNTVGAYAAGVLAGRRSKKNLLSAIYLGRAVVIALFVLTPVSTRACSSSPPPWDCSGFRPCRRPPAWSR
jgi:predicted MFS family arabinose efflux permease